MKKLLFLSMLVVAACASEAQQSPRVTAEGEGVKVSYGQPSKRGRVIFGELVPYNQVWRAGANKGTEITFDKDVTFAGKPVKAGTYSLFITPTENEWTIHLNPELNQNGAFGYDAIKSKNILEVKVPARKSEQPVEKLTYRFNKNNLVIEWDATQVEVPVKMS